MCVLVLREKERVKMFLRQTGKNHPSLTVCNVTAENFNIVCIMGTIITSLWEYGTLS